MIDDMDANIVMNDYHAPNTYFAARPEKWFSLVHIVTRAPIVSHSVTWCNTIMAVSQQ